MSLQQLENHACFGGQQQVWQHPSTSLHCDMRFGVYLPPQALAGQLGMPPFAVEKAAKVARRWNGDAVSRAVILMADLDAAVKGQTGGDDKFAIEDAVRRVAELAR